MSLGYFNQKNPFIVAVLATLIDEKSINIDLFFRDVVARSNGSYKNSDIGTVLDIGLYQCKP